MKQWEPGWKDVAEELKAENERLLLRFQEEVAEVIYLRKAIEEAIYKYHSPNTFMQLPCGHKITEEQFFNTSMAKYFLQDLKKALEGASK